jgi:hypothetical protein
MGIDSKGTSMSTPTNSPEDIVQTHLEVFRRLAKSDLPISPDACRALDLVDMEEGK